MAKKFLKSKTPPINFPDDSSPKRSTKVEEKSSKLIYYFQVHRSNLPKYFTYGVISPACYFGNRVIDDVQTSLNQYLVLSIGKIGLPDKESILIELYFSEAEKKELIPHGKIFLYPKPIPISRVTSIYTKDIATKDFITSTLKTQDAGPIPEHLFKSSFPKGLKKATIIKKAPKKVSKELVETNRNFLDRYDRILGALSLMKNCMLYYTDKNKTYQNFPDHFFELLSHMSAKFTSKHEKVKRIYLSFVNSSTAKEEVKEIKYIINYILSKQDLGEEFLEEFKNEVLIVEENSTFKKEMNEVITILKQPIGKKKALGKIRESKNAKKYFFSIVAFLNLYPHPDDIESLRHNLNKEVPDGQRANEILSFLGFMYGYSQIRPYEKLTFQEKQFEELQGSRINVKFELDTRFDYFLFESVFQYIFNENREVPIEFIEKLNYPPKKEIDISNEITDDPKFIFERKEEIFDKQLLTIRLRSEEEIIIDAIVIYPEHITMDYLLFSYLSKTHPKKVTTIKNKSVFEKKWFIKYLRENKLKDINHITYCFEGDEKFNLKKK